MTKRKRTKRFQPFLVLLSSDEFGSETFRYDSQREALAGMARLKKEARKCQKSDGIERVVAYLGEAEEEMPECDDQTREDGER